MDSTSPSAVACPNYLVVSTRMIGGLSILWGLYSLFHLHNAFFKLPPELVSGGLWEFADTKQFEIFVLAGFIVSGFGLILLKPWARFGIIAISLAYLVPGFFVPLAFWGTSLGYWYTLSIPSIAILIFWYFSKPAIKHLLPLKFTLTSLFIFAGFIYLFIAGFAGWTFSKYGNMSYTFNEVEIPSKSNSDTDNLVRRKLPFGYSLKVPPSSIVSQIVDLRDKPDSRKNSNPNTGSAFDDELRRIFEIIYLNDQKEVCMIQIKNQSLIGIFAKGWGPLVGISNEETMTDILLREKFGAAGWASRAFAGKLQQTNFYSSNGWDIYHLFSADDENKMEYFILFHENIPMGEINTFCTEGAVPRSFLLSLKLHSDSSSNIDEQIAEGDRLFKNEQYEAASFAYGSAVYQSPKNAPIYLKLAEAQVHTELFFLAGLPLERAAKLRGDPQEIKKIQSLLDKKSEEHGRKFGHHK